jgi:acetyl/propionyl-CoA carboxylase alpha subunit
VNQIRSIAVANRGEVAVRIIHACKELGIESVLLHSEPDQKTRAFRMADRTVCIGAAATSESYLNIESNVNAAAGAGVDAIHPGFGFLSENAHFAKAVAEARMIFIGPSPESINLFGDKISAKNLVEQAGGPTIPGYQGVDQSTETLLEKIKEIGLPCMVKAAAGGGGRGLKVVTEMSEAEEAIAAAKREGLSSFGSESVFVEKYLGNSKHIEIQIFGDAAGKVYALGERECSVQRRHQKIIEEALAPSLSQDTREAMYKAACDIGKAAKYRGAGTVEFLYQDEEFYFLEMNTRLQVEHPVTEFVAGIDLVKAQIKTAMGEALNWPSELAFHGHSIECRLYAEDPYMGGIPSTGEVAGVQFPYGPGRRFDYGFEAGDEVTGYYDSMIAKVIVWDETRARAIKKMRQTLKETVVFGVKTNIPYLLKILEHPEFVDGSMTTRFIDQHFAEGISAPTLSASEKQAIEKLHRLVGGEQSKGLSAADVSPWSYEWRPM